MSEMEKKRNKNLERKINGWERILNVQFPQSYRQFLLERGSATIGGFRIFGLPGREIKLSVLEATLILRKMRPEY